ncbi:taste receptor type 1 member 2-like [Xenia sp. Carnegie-2017]|uniref:taste receptor type 1 member 2-like n=1 Tax=Xenia sp. Carnegie-2017 TaxID=2897299 RepID=UPI001F04F4B8|nr:taste receptor type 1 member 2-like [Xenia sp. Carnegie-2017]
MCSNTAVFAIFCLHIFSSVYGCFKSGDVIVGMLLHLHQPSDDGKCVNDIESIIKLEAIIYATNQLSIMKEKEKVGYDVVNTNSTISTRAKIDFALNKWFNDTTNFTLIAIIADLPKPSDFVSLRKKLEGKRKKLPIISLKDRRDTCSMSPRRDMSAGLIYEFIRYLNWSIFDLIQHKDGSYADLKQITQDSDVCVLNELIFSDDEITWMKRHKRQSPAAVLFSKSDNVSSIIEKLLDHNISMYNIILGHEVFDLMSPNVHNISGVVGFKMYHEKFENHLQKSQWLNRTIKKTFCSEVSVNECIQFKDKVITEKSYLGWFVFQAVYEVLKSRQNETSQLPTTCLQILSAANATVRSLNSNDSTPNDFGFHILNLQEDGFVKVGRIKFRPEIVISLNRKIIWNNNVSQARCSLDCEPGTWKKDWKGVGRCCWDCMKCARETVSSYRNSPSCMVCPKGKKPTSDQSKCQPPYYDYLKWHDPFSIIMIFLLVFTLSFLIYALNVFIKNTNSPVFLRSKTASLQLLFSLCITFLLPVVLLMKPSPITCGVYYTIFMFSLGIPLTFLIVSSHNIINYSYDENGESKRKWFSCKPQTMISIFLIILQLIVVVVILCVETPKVLTYTPPGSDVEYIECASHSRPVFLPPIFFILLLTVIFNILHKKEEISPLNHNEVKFVSLGIYLLYAKIFVYFVAVFAINGKQKIRVLCGLAYLFGVNIFATVFLPKIYVILFKPEDSLHGVGPLLKDENGNETVIRPMQSRKPDCNVHSLLFPLGEYPYDHTEV